MDTGFDMETYVKQRLTEITDVDERSFAKEVLLKGLLPAFRTMERRYQELEERVKREIEIQNQNFIVMTMVIKRQNFDPTNHTLHPVCEETAEEEEISLPVIYFWGDERQKRNFEAVEKFTATDANGKIHQVGVRRSTKYQSAVENLYNVFVYNRIQWNTVNTGHIDRFYEIFPLDDTEIIEDWEISYGEWAEYIHTDCMAVWNVEKFRFHCTEFMVPNLDGKYYEHELDLEYYDKDSGYMVECNEDIISIRYEKNKVIITSLKETFENWIAYRFGTKVDVESYGYGNKILSNRKDIHFADHLIERQGRGLHSKTEIFRIVEGLNVGEYIKLIDCNICEQEREDSYSADMNRFIREEVFPMETRRILELQFVSQENVKQEEQYYMEDMLRYVISQVQLLLDEYKCVGVLG